MALISLVPTQLQSPDRPIRRAESWLAGALQWIWWRSSLAAAPGGGGPPRPACALTLLTGATETARWWRPKPPQAFLGGEHGLRRRPWRMWSCASAAVAVKASNRKWRLFEVRTSRLSPGLVAGGSR